MSLWPDYTRVVAGVAIAMIVFVLPIIIFLFAFVQGAP